MYTCIHVYRHNCSYALVRTLNVEENFAFRCEKLARRYFFYVLAFDTRDIQCDWFICAVCVDIVIFFITLIEIHYSFHITRN